MHLTYFTDNVHGTVIDSSPVPNFITSEGDGFVSDDKQYLMVRDAVEYIHDLIFGAANLTKSSLVPGYG